MNTDTLCIKTINESANLTAQQNIDADIILPDYYDTIGKILKCEISPVAEAVTTSGDKISLAGIAKFSMLYIGEDDKMYCYENEYRYTKVFQSQYAEKCLSTRVSQTVFSLNCRAIAPKRIELRAVLQIGLKIINEADKSFIRSTDENCVITKNENISYFSPVNLVTRSFSVSSSYPLADFSDKIDVIIRKESKIKVSEIKTIHNKAYIKALAETEILYYSNESGNAGTTVLSIPVSEIIDIFGAEDDDDCEVVFNDIFTDIVLKNNDSESPSLDVRLDVNLQAEITRKLTDNIISDVYSVKNELYTAKDAVEITTSRKKVSKTESVLFETDVYDDCGFTVIDSWISNMRISFDNHSDKSNLLVTGTFNSLIKNEYGTLSIVTREHTFETVLLTDADAVITRISDQVLSVSALQLPTGKLRFSAEINFEADVCVKCKVNGFTTIEICDELCCDSASRYTVYFAKQNEDIWSVAKENRSSVEGIKALNNLSGEVLNEDRMLLLPSF